LPPSKTQDDRAIKGNLKLQPWPSSTSRATPSTWPASTLDRVAEDALDNGMNDEALRNLTKQLTELGERVTQIRTQMDDLAINRRASPLEKAAFARANGAPGWRSSSLRRSTTPAATSRASGPPWSTSIARSASPTRPST